MFFFMLHITYSNPTPVKNDWRRYTHDDKYIEYFNLKAPEIENEIVNRNKRVSFWNELLPKLSVASRRYLGSPLKEIRSSGNFSTA